MRHLRKHSHTGTAWCTLGAATGTAAAAARLRDALRVGGGQALEVAPRQGNHAPGAALALISQKGIHAMAPSDACGSRHQRRALATAAAAAWLLGPHSSSAWVLAAV